MCRSLLSLVIPNTGSSDVTVATNGYASLTARKLAVVFSALQHNEVAPVLLPLLTATPTLCLVLSFLLPHLS